MSEAWRDVGLACMSVEDLPILADLRRRPGIRVSIIERRAWIWWEPDSEAMQHMLVRRIMPLPGVELFVRRGGRYYRLGDHLPAFDVPVTDGFEGMGLDRILLPRPITGRRPAEKPPDPMLVGVAPDHRGIPRGPTALRCRLAELSAWADGATSARIEALQGAWTAGPGGDRGDPEVLVIAPRGGLPVVPSGVRYWGADLLIPLGFRADPDLPETALRRAIGAGALDLAILDVEGMEVISRRAFRPLSRASLRLAARGRASDPSRGGSDE